MTIRKQLCWEDVEEGQELPSSYTMPITWTKLVHSVSGTRDFNPQHHDPDFCREMGYQHPFVMLNFYQGLLGRLISDWIGEEGFLSRCHLEMRKMNMLYDTMTMKGKVTRKYVRGLEHLVDVDIWIENDKQGVTTPGDCTVILPVKG
jgi:acyl dehydratase